MLSGTGNLWKIELIIPVTTIKMFEYALEQIGESVEAVLAFEVDNELWNLSALLREPPNHMALTVLLAMTAAATGLETTPDFTVTRVEAQEWAVNDSFPPLIVGCFYIYGEHVTAPLPVAKVPLLIDATIAFGSGEHQSTQGCLLAIEWLTRNRQRFQRCIDIGCGTGILSLAVAKLWHADVYAVDSDSAAVRVTHFNARRNGVHRLVLAQQRDAFIALAAKSTRQPFDLVLANLFASPLIHMARELAKKLQPGGWAVLSGLLTSQEKKIRNIYQGFSLANRIRIVRAPWLTLILQKSHGFVYARVSQEKREIFEERD